MIFFTERLRAAFEGQATLSRSTLLMRLFHAYDGEDVFFKSRLDKMIDESIGRGLLVVGALDPVTDDAILRANLPAEPHDAYI